MLVAQSKLSRWCLGGQVVGDLQHKLEMAVVLVTSTVVLRRRFGPCAETLAVKLISCIMTSIPSAPHNFPNPKLEYGSTQERWFLIKRQEI